MPKTIVLKDCQISELVLGNKNIYHNDATCDNPKNKLQRDAEDVLEESEDINERKPGPKKQILFVNPKGEEDLERTHKEAQRIAKYISDHHMGRMRLDSKSHNPLTWLAVCMWYRWNELGWVDKNLQGAAMYRFLTETCGIACEVEPRAFTSTFCRIVRSGKKDPEIYDNLCAYFPE